VRINLHNHTYYSDGSFSPEELIECAIEYNFTHIGITDHYTSKTPGSRCVMDYGLRKYIKELRVLTKKYSSHIRVLIGLEVIFSITQTDFSAFNLIFPDKNPLNDLDFILFEYVDEAEFIGLSLRELTKIRHLLRIPVGLAHSDLSKSFVHIPPKKLAKILSENKIFIELCPNLRNSRAPMTGHPEQKIDFLSFLKPISGNETTYIPYYRVNNAYNDAFYKAIQKDNVLLSIGSDTHEFKDEVYSTQDSENFLREKNIEDLLICYHTWPFG